MRWNLLAIGACTVALFLVAAETGAAMPAASRGFAAMPSVPTRHQTVTPRGPLYFDGRASRIGLSRSLSSTAEPSAAGWACLCFLGDGISIKADGRFGSVFAVTAGPGYHNPFFDPGPWRTSSELSARRPVRLGQWDWYADSVKLLPGFNTTADWALVADMNYPTISHTPLEIDYDKYGVGISRDVGYIEQVFGAAPIRDVQRFWRPDAYPALIGKWIDWVIGVRWATNTSGALRVYTRCTACRNAGWVLRYSLSRAITMQWGGGVMTADGRDPTTGREMMTLDKMGLYYGYTQPQSFALPTNHVLEMGIVRASTRDAAMSVFPSRR
jgi:hypothetical protein